MIFVSHIRKGLSWLLKTWENIVNKNKKPTQAQLKELYDYDPDTGFLVRKTQGTGVRRELRAKAGYYIKVQFGDKWYFGHRIIWMMVYGHWPDEVDHINGNRTDNRLCNLRNVTRQENARNRCKSKNNTSGVVGVSWHILRNKWQAHIVVNNERLHLGNFNNKEDAIAARKAAEVKHGFHKNHGRSAVNNRNKATQQLTTA